MHTLKDLIDELIPKIQGEFSYRDLMSCDKHMLAAAYILENEDIIFDIFADVHTTSLAHHFAKLTHSVADCDVFDMATDIRKAIIASGDLERLIDTEIELRRRSYERDHAIETAEQWADLARESA